MSVKGSRLISGSDNQLLNISEQGHGLEIAADGVNGLLKGKSRVSLDLNAVMRCKTRYQSKNSRLI